MFWINLLMKSTYLNHWKLTINNLKSLLRFWLVSNGIFNVTNKNNTFIFLSVFTNAEWNVVTISWGALELESLKEENNRIINDEGYITEEDYRFTIKPNFSILWFILKIEPSRGKQIRFVQDDTLRNLLGFKPTVTHGEYNLTLSCWHFIFWNYFPWMWYCSTKNF